MLCYITSYHVILYYIMVYYIIFYYIIFKVDVGTLTVIGPSPINHARTCVSGQSCSFAGITGMHLSSNDRIMLLDTCGTGGLTSPWLMSVTWDVLDRQGREVTWRVPSLDANNGRAMSWRPPSATSSFAPNKTGWEHFILTGIYIYIYIYTHAIIYIYIYIYIHAHMCI